MAGNKDKIQEVMDRLSEGVASIMTSDEYIKMLKVMSTFHSYSFNNCMMILMQKPDATLCKGFNAWKKLGRHVKAGEEGIKILAPVIKKIKCKQKSKDENGEEIEEVVERSIWNFRIVHVFDISQTEGKDLPEIKIEDLTGDITDFDNFVEKVREISTVPIFFEDIQGSAKGYYSRTSESIHIKAGMSEKQTMKTLLHELAHSILHAKKTDTTRGDREIEAESVAFIVSNFLGIDTSDYSFPYIASWSDSVNLKEKQAVLNNIQATAEFIISEFIGGTDDCDKRAV